MSTIEQLTDAERETLAWPMPHRAEAKALRIIDQQAALIAQLTAERDAAHQALELQEDEAALPWNEYRGREP
jgi:hypothetical protein